MSLPVALAILAGAIAGGVALWCALPDEPSTGRHHVRPTCRDQRSGQPVASPTRRRLDHTADTLRLVPVDERDVERTDVVVDEVQLVRPYVVGRGR